MNRETLSKLIHVYGLRADFPLQGIEDLQLQAQNLPSGALEYLSFLEDDYAENSRLTYEMQMEFEKLSSDVHCFPAQMMFYMALLPILEKKYTQKGLPNAYFDRVLFDLRAKLLECHDVYGIWGSFVAIWFARFFNFSLYGIERLEFAPFHTECDYEGQGVKLKKGDKAIDVHIPSGAPLPYEEVARSYRAAAEFFDCNVFVCESWLLYPANRTLFENCPNLKAFWQDYDIWEEGESREDLWRIFGKKHEEAPENLPRDTTLRRVYADRLKKGLPVGWGKGIFVLK